MFRDRIDAWREAEQAGRSLADHLAEVSSEDAVSSGSGDEEDLDPQASIELRNRFASEPSAVTDVQPETMPAKRLASRDSAPVISRAASQPVIAPAPVEPGASVPPEAPLRARSVPTADASIRAGGSRVIMIMVVLIVLGCAAAAWMLWLRSPSTEDSRVAPSVRMAALTAEPDAAVADAAEAVDDIVEQEITENDPPPIDATEIEIADAVESAETDPAEVDAGEKGSHRRGNRKKPNAPTGARTPKDAGAPKVETAKGPCQPPGKVDPFDARPVCTAVAAKPPKDAAPPLRPKPTGPPPGTIDAAQVKTIVRSHLGEIETCVSRARMDDRDLTGRVQIRVDVSPAGRVTRTSIVSSKGATAALEACMRSAVASWTFPAPAGGVRGAFSYPFAF